MRSRSVGKYSKFSPIYAFFRPLIFEGSFRENRKNTANPMNFSGIRNDFFSVPQPPSRPDPRVDPDGPPFSALQKATTTLRRGGADPVSAQPPPATIRNMSGGSAPPRKIPAEEGRKAFGSAVRCRRTTTAPYGGTGTSSGLASENDVRLARTQGPSEQGRGYRETSDTNAKGLCGPAEPGSRPRPDAGERIPLRLRTTTDGKRNRPHEGGRSYADIQKERRRPRRSVSVSGASVRTVLSRVSFRYQAASGSK